MSKRSRFLLHSAVIGAVLATGVMGTFAWQSIGQKATNEFMGSANPGARLHDDFDGRNKDVYVENFSDPKSGGTDVFMRVRLKEYMEIGTGAAPATVRKEAEGAKSIVPEAQKSDKSTWTVFKLNENTAFRTYWDLKLGGETVFMPTFNKNKDSLAADINGTLAGPDKDPNNTADNYTDYKEYTAGETLTKNAYYDADSNNVDEGASNSDNLGNGGTQDTNYTTKSEEHTAKKTRNSTIMTMDEWLKNGKKSGDFWVFDEDGWAYWADALAPGEATGLLLDEVTPRVKPADDYYYAIDVEAQFATAGDFGTPKAGSTGGLGDNPTGKGGTGFYSEGVTPNAQRLLDIVSAPYSAIGKQINIIDVGSKDTVTIDGMEWYVIAKEGYKALLFSAKAIPASDKAIGETWENSVIRTYLNGDFFNDKSDLSRMVVSTDITTKKAFGGQEWTTTKDKAFLLSEADLFGTTSGGATDSRDFTFKGKVIPNNEELRKDASSDYYWLRSPGNSAGTGAYVTSASGILAFYGSTWATKVRPAMWVDMSK